VAKRAVAYGIPGEQVDGNDVEAVYEVVEHAANRSRRGEGPSIIECLTYRWEPHSLFTRGELRPQREVQEWKKRDPIERYRRRLLERKITVAGQLDEIQAEVLQVMASAAEFAKASPMPQPATALEDVEV